MIPKRFKRGTQTVKNPNAKLTPRRMIQADTSSSQGPDRINSRSSNYGSVIKTGSLTKMQRQILNNDQNSVIKDEKSKSPTYKNSKSDKKGLSSNKR